MLKISVSLALPLDAVTQTFGILAVRGAGKTNAARVMAEEMHGAGLPFVAVDPVGSWHGLRSSADGRSPGLPVPIFGGRRGDVPIERGGGVLVADLVAERRLSCVLDVSELSEGDKVRFLTDFAERLYRRNTEPLHLFLEEADDYIPQRPRREQARCLGAWESIVRRGRARGLGVTLITQRSAALAKMVLTQIETLIVLRTTSPQDRAAVEAWIKYHAVGDEILRTLPELVAGEAWVWSPQWLKLAEPQRIRFRLARTYDSGATPTMRTGARRPVATLADVDLAEVRVAMAETIERAKAEDPRELRKEIARLRQRLAEVERERSTPEPVVERVEVPVVSPEVAAALVRTGDLIAEAGKALAATVPEIQARAIEIQAAVRRFAAPRESASQAVVAHQHAAILGPALPRPAPVRAVTAAALVNSDGKLTGPEQRVLDALAELEALGIQQAPRLQVALFAGYSNLASKGFSNSVGALRTAGRIGYPEPGTISLTKTGRLLAVQTERPRTTSELHERVIAMVTGPSGRILLPLIDAYPNAMDRDDLMAAAGYSNLASKGFSNTIGRLRTLGLIDYPSPGLVVAREILFPATRK